MKILDCQIEMYKTHNFSTSIKLDTQPGTAAKRTNTYLHNLIDSLGKQGLGPREPIAESRMQVVSQVQSNHHSCNWQTSKISSLVKHLLNHISLPLCMLVIPPVLLQEFPDITSSPHETIRCSVAAPTIWRICTGKDCPIQSHTL